MNMLESFDWVVVGFIPTMCALKIAWKVGVVKKCDVKEEGKKRYLQMYANNNSNSTEPLEQLLLQIPKKKFIGEKSNDYDNNQLHSSLIYLSIKNFCKDIIHIGAYAEEYYHVELVCDGDSEIVYCIQAYGEQAKELYKEINTFSTSRRRLCHKEAEELAENNNSNYKEEQQLLVKKAIDCMADYDLASGCVLIFRKFKNICISKRKIMYE